ncbi:hypothetical protein CALVIDRAFT_361046 [Calocera viscosa TUFC12733]|uniref:Uncharacterized protein n=1 Tax=Calocera viscosa (strain TUFC12733) TaxID=1330018 RepID=A0A167H692_CALVF|nr:hypothetical protein CALVIDRAFT_361046 [Calocera viscosa TUFC12733]
MAGARNLALATRTNSMRVNTAPHPEQVHVRKHPVRARRALPPGSEASMEILVVLRVYAAYPTLSETHDGHTNRRFMNAHIAFIESSNAAGLVRVLTLPASTLTARLVTAVVSLFPDLQIPPSSPGDTRNIPTDVESFPLVPVYPKHSQLVPRSPLPATFGEIVKSLSRFVRPKLTGANLPPVIEFAPTHGPISKYGSPHTPHNTVWQLNSFGSDLEDCGRNTPRKPVDLAQLRSEVTQPCRSSCASVRYSPAPSSTSTTHGGNSLLPQPAMANNFLSPTAVPSNHALTSAPASALPFPFVLPPNAPFPPLHGLFQQGTTDGSLQLHLANNVTSHNGWYPPNWSPMSPSAGVNVYPVSGNNSQPHPDPRITFPSAHRALLQRPTDESRGPIANALHHASGQVRTSMTSSLCLPTPDSGVVPPPPAPHVHYQSMPSAAISLPTRPYANSYYPGDIPPTSSGILPPATGILPTRSDTLSTMAGILPTSPHILSTASSIPPTPSDPLPITASILSTSPHILPTASSIVPTPSDTLSAASGILPTSSGILSIASGILHTPSGIPSSLSGPLVEVGRTPSGTPHRPTQLDASETTSARPKGNTTVLRTWTSAINTAAHVDRRTAAFDYYPPCTDLQHASTALREYLCDAVKPRLGLIPDVPRSIPALLSDIWFPITAGRGVGRGMTLEICQATFETFTSSLLPLSFGDYMTLRVKPLSLGAPLEARELSPSEQVDFAALGLLVVVFMKLFNFGPASLSPALVLAAVTDINSITLRSLRWCAPEIADFVDAFIAMGPSGRLKPVSQSMDPYHPEYALASIIYGVANLQDTDLSTHRTPALHLAWLSTILHRVLFLADRQDTAALEAFVVGLDAPFYPQTLRESVPILHRHLYSHSAVNSFLFRPCYHLKSTRAN